MKYLRLTPHNLGSQSVSESNILFINFSRYIPVFLKVEDTKVKIPETDTSIFEPSEATPVPHAPQS